MRTAYQDPVSRTASLARAIGLFAVPVTIIAVLVSRSGKVEALPALIAIASGLVLALLAILLACAGFASIWIKGHRGGGKALTGLTVACAILAYPLYKAADGMSYPAISDITTDLANPPQLTAATLQRLPTENSTVYPGESSALNQIAGYPEIVPVTADLPVLETHAIAVQLMRARGWQIVMGERPVDKAPEQTIEAVTSSLVLGLKSDVVVRIRPVDKGSRIDMRSASRFGSRDFGMNAQQVRSYMAELMTATR